MAHFLKFADPPVNKAVIALVDPDMVFVSKLTPYVGEDPCAMPTEKQYADMAVCF